MKHLFSLFQAAAALIALALSLMVGPVLADQPVTKWQFGCEWKQGANGNYWFKVDGGCRHYRALGYSTMADYNRDVPVPDAPDSGNEPDPGCEPGKDEAV